MFMFGNPWWLLALLAVPPLVAWRWWPRRRAAVLSSDAASLASLPRSWRHWARWALPVLQALGMASLAVALARPQTALTNSRVETEGVDMVLLVDTSGSMEIQDFSSRRPLSRMEGTKSALKRFIEARPDDRLALVAFADMPYALAPLTTDHAWLLEQTDRLQSRMVGEMTAIGDAIASAVNRLRDSKAKSKLVILLTDGRQTSGELSPLDAAQAAAALGVKIHVVAAAGEPKNARRSAFVRVAPQDEVDEELLKQLAETTGGRYFRAGDEESLRETYAAIDEMEKTEIRQDAYTRHKELFAYCVYAALALLAAEWLLGATGLGRVPA